MNRVNSAITVDRLGFRFPRKRHFRLSGTLKVNFCLSRGTHENLAAYVSLVRYESCKTDISFEYCRHPLGYPGSRGPFAKYLKKTRSRKPSVPLTEHKLSTGNPLNLCVLSFCSINSLQCAGFTVCFISIEIATKCAWINAKIQWGMKPVISCTTIR